MDNLSERKKTNGLLLYEDDTKRDSDKKTVQQQVPRPAPSGNSTHEDKICCEQKTVTSFLAGVSREPERDMSRQNCDYSESVRRAHGDNDGWK